MLRRTHRPGRSPVFINRQPPWPLLFAGKRKKQKKPGRRPPAKRIPPQLKPKAGPGFWKKLGATFSQSIVAEFAKIIARFFFSLVIPTVVSWAPPTTAPDHSLPEKHPLVATFERKKEDDSFIS